MPTSEYAEILTWLYTLEAAKGMDFKLERVALALKSLGEPHKQFAAIHIAGTNGKGSVAAMLHAMLSAGGYRVGLYTSPHLVSLTERIRVGAEEIGEAAVVALAREIRTAATVRGIDLTFFEFVTVMAFLHFARSGVELAVVEVGLGGRLDATNVVDPAVAVITGIGLDHQEFLGDTLGSVAREKAGIIKPGCRVVIGRVPNEARAVLQHAVDDCGADAQWAGRDFSVGGAPRFRFTGWAEVVDDVELALRGAYQRENAAVAIAAAMRVRDRFPISSAHLRRGLATVRWPGRLDVVQSAPLVVLDGAHNVDGITALVRELPAVVGRRRVHLLFAVMCDKRWQPMVETLAPHAASATVTTILPPRGADPDVLAPVFARFCPTSIVSEPVDGFDRLRQSVSGDDAIVATGSLFLLGAIYPSVLRRRGQDRLFSPAGATLHP